ncbi:LysR family transcriptional regulator [Herbaspirillum lusitanum]|uniref:LysR family transcriptional regulator n=1 Tax=Herbaspirillum lusitanum TaxID=213312 RepID=UPI0003786B4B|nr:LysR family transcriptional regulator [Herbaspirillum lusitanum]
MNKLRQLDLNLLVTLDVLLSEHNVTRAAQRLNFSQPSVSVHLAKLREIFSDPLLLPGSRGMQPTARAEELREPLRVALQALERAVAPGGGFDPASADNTWRIAATDASETAVLLPALPGLRAAAPGTRLAVVELARQRVLFRERYVLVGRSGHPKLRRKPTPAQFCALEHVIVSPDGGGFRGVTDDALAAAGLTRRVVLSVPHFLFMMSVLANTDMVAMVPSRLMRGSAALQVVEPPFDVAGYDMAMLWHERSHRDPAHQWLRDHLAASV